MPWRRASFRETSPSLAAWLEDWLARPTPREERDAQLGAALFAVPEGPTVPEVSRAYWAAMSPEQRASYGLPATGWGRALFGDAWGDDPRDQSDG